MQERGVNLLFLSIDCLMTLKWCFFFSDVMFSRLMILFANRLVYAKILFYLDSGNSYRSASLISSSSNLSISDATLMLRVVDWLVWVDRVWTILRADFIYIIQHCNIFCYLGWVFSGDGINDHFLLVSFTNWVWFLLIFSIWSYKLNLDLV